MEILAGQLRRVVHPGSCLVFKQLLCSSHRSALWIGTVSPLLMVLMLQLDTSPSNSIPGGLLFAQLQNSSYSSKGFQWLRDAEIQKRMPKELKSVDDSREQAPRRHMDDSGQLGLSQWLFFTFYSNKGRSQTSQILFRLSCSISFLETVGIHLESHSAPQPWCHRGLKMMWAL